MRVKSGRIRPKAGFETIFCECRLGAQFDRYCGFLECPASIAQTLETLHVGRYLDQTRAAFSSRKADDLWQFR